MAGAGNAAAAMTAVVIVLAVTAAAPPHAFRTSFPEDAELVRNAGRATVVEMAVPGIPVPAGGPRDVELIAFAGHAADGVRDVSPSSTPSASVDGLLPDSERAAADVILP
ncbi:hypothetical protein E2562_017319 [Oryza meyeriana var. granulata]|uniref:Uncharacterized protein n=1 Tax=Oryza meyeriana var. granulata TaxID=110450 RepID=A0A6G1EMB7_9ORYZ|nr:hypothetical protein E2562_017319 [Oryza meyeriana var. granulata]